MRVCSCCGQEKALDEYYKNTDGRPFRRCKACSIAAAKKWAAEHPARFQEIQKAARAREAARPYKHWVRGFVGPRRPKMRHWVRGFQGPPKPTFDQWFENFGWTLLALVPAAVEARRKLKRQHEREWLSRNRDKARIRSQAKRHRRRGATGTYTKADIDRLFLFQKGFCAICREKLTRFDVDHVMPIALGGTNDPENLQLLCPPCNNRKGAMHPGEFMKQRGYLL